MNPLEFIQNQPGGSVRVLQSSSGDGPCDRLRKWVLHGEGIQEVENTVMRAFAFLSTLPVFI